MECDRARKGIVSKRGWRIQLLPITSRKSISSIYLHPIIPMTILKASQLGGAVRCHLQDSKQGELLGRVLAAVTPLSFLSMPAVCGTAAVPCGRGAATKLGEEKKSSWTLGLLLLLLLRFCSLAASFASPPNNYSDPSTHSRCSLFNSIFGTLQF